MAAISSISHYSLRALHFSFLSSFVGLFILSGLLSPSLCLLLTVPFGVVQNFTTYYTHSMAMTARHVQMCSGSALTSRPYTHKTFS